MYYTRFETEICEIILAGDESGLANLDLNSGEGRRIVNIDPVWERNDDFFDEAVYQIREYLEGRRIHFDLKLNPSGTEFQERVWELLKTIPYGETRSYGELAAELGNPNASRAVGAANGKNPLPLIIPCHRVIGASGKMTGYAFGISIKEKLLTLEKRTL